MQHARARPSADVGCRDLAFLGTSYEWGRRVVLTCCFRFCFPSGLDAMCRLLCDVVVDKLCCACGTDK